MVTYVIKVTEFNSEVRCDLPGRLEAAMASEATNMAVGGITVETAYKVYVCPRGNLLYCRPYFINDPTVKSNPIYSFVAMHF